MSELDLQDTHDSETKPKAKLLLFSNTLLPSTLLSCYRLFSALIVLDCFLAFDFAEILHLQKMYADESFRRTRFASRTSLI